MVLIHHLWLENILSTWWQIFLAKYWYQNSLRREIIFRLISIYVFRLNINYKERINKLNPLLLLLLLLERLWTTYWKGGYPFTRRLHEFLKKQSINVVIVVMNSAVILIDFLSRMGNKFLGKCIKYNIKLSGFNKLFVGLLNEKFENTCSYISVIIVK